MLGIRRSRSVQAPTTASATNGSRASWPPPSSHFCDGAGWSVKPMPSNPAAEGSAHFAFVSKYQNGASVPTGTTSFRFKAGGLVFNATEYEWLVIAGARAQYKGKGTVNGEAGYGFYVDGFVRALLGSVVISLVSWLLSVLLIDDD